MYSISKHLRRRYIRVALLVRYACYVFLDLIYLFVINHNGYTKETVEKFRFDEKTRKLYLLRTFTDDPTFVQSVSLEHTRQLLQMKPYRSLQTFKLLSVFCVVIYLRQIVICFNSISVIEFILSVF